MSAAIRIFRWADAPPEYRVTAERQWVAFVPNDRAFDGETDAGWKDLVTAIVEGGYVQAGNANA